MPLTLTSLLHVPAFNAKTSIFRLDRQSQSPNLLFPLNIFLILSFYFIFEGRILNTAKNKFQINKIKKKKMCLLQTLYIYLAFAFPFNLRVSSGTF